MITRTVSDTFKDCIITLEKKNVGEMRWNTRLPVGVKFMGRTLKNDSAVKSEILKLNVRSKANMVGGELL